MIVFDLTVAPSDAWLNAGIKERKGKILRAVEQLFYCQEWCPSKKFSNRVTLQMPKLRLEAYYGHLYATVSTFSLDHIENLQEQLRDKDKQLTNLKDRVKSLQTDSSNTDTALATLEEALSEKERIIERLKEQRERDDRERIQEIESFKKENKDLKEKVNALQAELTEKESSLIDLKEHASSLASAGLKRDSKLKALEIAIEQKKEECSKLEAQLQ
ncbi:hypothetical protein E2320_015018, partial [Naja naja]